MDKTEKACAICKNFDEKDSSFVGLALKFNIAGIVYALLNNFDDKSVLECATKLAAQIAAVKGAVPDNAEYLANL